MDILIISKLIGFWLGVSRLISHVLVSDYIMGEDEYLDEEVEDDAVGGGGSR